jgi:hypothetical protein
MKPASYYARTEKGAAEVAQRSQAIPARARSLLLMIDGKSTGAQLLEKLAAFPNSGELLQLLETEGYIGPVDGGGAAVLAPAAAPASTASVTAAPAAASPAVASPGTGSVSGIGAAKRFMIRSLHEIFGPDADSLTGKVDLAQTTEDLRKLAEKHRELMASMGSRRKADAYWQGIEELLPAP